MHKIADFPGSLLSHCHLRDRCYFGLLIYIYSYVFLFCRKSINLRNDLMNDCLSHWFLCVFFMPFFEGTVRVFLKNLFSFFDIKRNPAGFASDHNMSTLTDWW